MADDEEIEWIREEEEESKTFDISDCARKLAETAAETKVLLNDMQVKSEKIDENNRKTQEDLAALRRAKTIEDEAQVPQAPAEQREIPCPLPPNVDAVNVGVGHLKNVAGVALLPGGNVLVADEQLGLVLFNFEGQILNTVIFGPSFLFIFQLKKAEWKNVRSPIYHKEHVLFLVDYADSGRQIIKLTAGLDYVARIEGPKWLNDRHVERDRIAIAHTDCIYLTACGSVLKRKSPPQNKVKIPRPRRIVSRIASTPLFGTFSAVYELSPVGQWTELDFKQSESFVDLVAFATIGPITQLLIIEARRNYVIQLSIRESQVVDRRKMAICERPGSLAKDEAGLFSSIQSNYSGRLFVANYGVVALVDTIRWTAIKPVAVAGAPSSVTGLNALGGLLAIPGKDVVRLQRYSFR